MAEWPCTGLQIRLPRFDSGFRLHSNTPHALNSKLDARVVELVEHEGFKIPRLTSRAGSIRPRSRLCGFITLPSVIYKMFNLQLI